MDHYGSQIKVESQLDELRTRKNFRLDKVDSFDRECVSFFVLCMFMQFLCSASSTDFASVSQ